MEKYLLKTEAKGYGIDGEDGWRRKKKKKRDEMRTLRRTQNRS